MKKPTKGAEPKASTEARTDAKSQTELFAKAMKQFQSGDYRRAKALFDEAAKGPVITVKESAVMYSRMCDQRLGKEKPELTTPEDHYNYGVGLMNDGRFLEARDYLQKALKGGEAAHIHYAIALASGHAGDVGGAVTSLQRAVELDPSTRSLARNDSDFQPLLQHPSIRELLVGEKSVNS
jgi:Tfp pilus assembly protein PilF